MGRSLISDEHAGKIRFARWMADYVRASINGRKWGI